MQLYMKDDNGRLYEIERAKELLQGNVVVFLTRSMHEKDVEEIEKMLQRKLGRKVVALDAKFRDIVTLPPVEKAVPVSFQTDSPE